jgi:hypothetical protein
MIRPGKISIELTNHEALVLFDFLARFGEENTRPLADQAEQQVLWKIEGILEKQLVEVISPDYDRLVTEAREQVRGPSSD